MELTHRLLVDLIGLLEEVDAFLERGHLLLACLVDLLECQGLTLIVPDESSLLSQLRQNLLGVLTADAAWRLLSSRIQRRLRSRG